jgi:regulator of replication initiation timing
MSHDYDKNQIFDRFIEIKDKLAELEKKHEKYRKMVEDLMIHENTNIISHTYGDDTYQIKKTLSARQSVSKSDLPEEIWEKYAKTSTFHIIRVDKVKDKKERKENKGKDKLFK